MPAHQTPMTFTPATSTPIPTTQALSTPMPTTPRLITPIGTTPMLTTPIGTMPIDDHPAAAPRASAMIEPFVNWEPLCQKSWAGSSPALDPQESCRIELWNGSVA